MKTSLIALSMLFSVAAVAGPEDHMNDTCYTATTAVPGFLPSTLCFADAQIDLTFNKVNFYGYATNFPDTADLDTYIRVNEDAYFFTAKAVIVNRNENICSESEFAELKISGNTDVVNQMDYKTLTVKVQYSQTHDSCHSIPDEGEIEYKLSK